MDRKLSTDLATELLNTADDLTHVTTVVEINCLEQTGLRHTVRFTKVDERLNVLHLKQPQQHRPGAYVDTCLPMTTNAPLRSFFLGGWSIGVRVQSTLGA